LEKFHANFGKTERQNLLMCCVEVGSKWYDSRYTQGRYRPIFGRKETHKRPPNDLYLEEILF
jgi:hypothetical protein